MKTHFGKIKHKKKHNYDFFQFRNIMELNKPVPFLQRHLGIDTRSLYTDADSDEEIQVELLNDTNKDIKKMEIQPTTTINYKSKTYFKKQNKKQQQLKYNPDIQNDFLKIEKISSLLWDSLQKEDFMKNLTKQDIKNVLLQTKDNNWNSSNIRDIVKQLKNYSIKKYTFLKNEKMKNIQKQDNLPNPEIRTDNFQQTNNHQDLEKLYDEYKKKTQEEASSLKIEKDEFMHVETKITINSNDRNKDIYPEPNNFKINIDSNYYPNRNNHNILESEKGIIYKKLNQVVKIELISAILPKNSENDSIESYPYLILEIPEFGSLENGTNKFLDESFGKLIFSTDCGNYKMHTNKLNIIEKQFNTPINLNSITIKIRKPNGEIYDFGKSIYRKIKESSSEEESEEESEEDKSNEEEDKSEEENRKNSNLMLPEISLDFKITCLKKKMKVLYPSLN